MAPDVQPPDGGPRAINLAEKFARFEERWSPRIIARVNDLDVKLVKVQGEFVWHRHADTDEFFLVHAGHLAIDLPDGTVELGPGECYVVPRGMEHRPRAEEPCEIVLLEPVGTVNTGDAGGNLTATGDPWA
jgi:mannose-6-phosphate isomerase-like protein (cupin superfamily)